MNVAVVGAGAIGAFVGACLARGGTETHLVARGEHLEAMRTGGVRVTGPAHDFQVDVHATGDPREIGIVDVVFLGLKAYSYADAGDLLEPLMGPQTAVIAAQNGIPWWYFHGLKGPYEGRRIESVDPGGSVTEVLSLDRAVGCVVYCSTELEGPGVVRHLEGTRFSIGEPVGGQSERCEAFSAAMIAGGLKCPVEADIRNDIWIKLLGNAAFNPISALARATMVEIATHQGTRATVRLMMEESLEIAAAVGCHPEISVDKRINGAERVGEHKTSMLQDLEKDKPLELDVILAAVVELADLTGTKAPTLRAVHAVADLLATKVGAPTP
jgi:2-dehydropantoate 2-reductase